jgi:hypothetical protein
MKANLQVNSSAALWQKAIPLSFELWLRPLHQSGFFALPQM